MSNTHQNKFAAAAKSIWAKVGFFGLIIALLWGELIYMNLRSADPILPGWEEYSAERFNTLMQREEPVLVEVYASWCPTCLLQHRAFETLVDEGRQPNVRAVRVDFDRDEAFRAPRNLNATGILILYRNGEEVARAAGLVTADKIEAFLSAHGIERLNA